MRIFLDTEFHEDGKTIELISLGAITEDGRAFYRESSEYDLNRATPWLQENVLPYLNRNAVVARTRSRIAREFRAWCGDSPEFWGWYADYDWVVLCQLYGSMVDLPQGWPMYCRDVKQLCDSRGNPQLPAEVIGTKHHALHDAGWIRRAWMHLQGRDLDKKGLGER